MLFIQLTKKAATNTLERERLKSLSKRFDLGFVVQQVRATDAS